MRGVIAYCPQCPSDFEFCAGGEWKLGPHPIAVVSHNARSNNVDLGYCKECGTGYAIHYSVTKLENDENCNQPSRKAIEEADVHARRREQERRIDEARKLIAEVEEQNQKAGNP